jgi:hypothetical protein
MGITYSLIVIRDRASPPDLSRGDIMNIDAPWDMVQEVAKLALSRYPGADRVYVVDPMGHVRWSWPEKG